MIDFIKHLQNKVYKPEHIPEYILKNALHKTILDVNYHFPDLSRQLIIERVQTNSNELAIYLYRIGRELHEQNLSKPLSQLHWLMKELCSCEIYFNNEIDEGFYVVHGQGTIIGSRNKIGKGFKIHQGCTIGHKENGVGRGSNIGDSVIMYCNSSIIGELSIGDDVVIGAYVLVTDHIRNNKIIINHPHNLLKDTL